MADKEDQEISKGRDFDPLKNPSCEPCAEQRIQVVAAFYCEECDEYLCETCFSNHKISKVTKCHVPILVSKKQVMDFKACEPCKEKNACRASVNFCKECEEYLCEDCTSRHKLSKATKAHVPVRIELLKSALNKAEDFIQQCEPYTTVGRSQLARNFCIPCEALLCERCTDNHLSTKATKSHVPIAMVFMKSLLTIQPECFCDICKLFQKQRKAEQYCQDCDETLCDKCIKIHSVQKQTKNHIKSLSEKQVDVEMCEFCALSGKNVASSVYCKECPEFLCHTCAELHKKQKATRDHVLGPLPPKSQRISKQCDLCLYEGVSLESTYYCSECEEFLCESCGKRHRSQKSTKSHQLCRSEEAIVNLEKCEQCLETGKTEIAENYCKECELCFCTNCSEIHKKQKATRNHYLVSVKQRNMESNSTSLMEETILKETLLQKNDVNAMRPGKPVATNIKADSLILSCDLPESFRDGDYYQVSYKDVDSGVPLIAAGCN